MPLKYEDFWYAVQLVKNHGGTTSYTNRSGMIQSRSGKLALKAIYLMYNKHDGLGWTVNTVRVCEVDKDGEVVATSENGPEEGHTCEKKDNELLLYEWSTPINHSKFPTGFKEESK